jgi:hypothetical protein
MHKLRTLGAQATRFGESGAAYIARLKDSHWLRPVRHPGNLAFTFDLAGRPRRSPSKA